MLRAGATTLADAEDAAMKAFEEMLRAEEPGRYSLAYMRKAAVNNFIKEKTRHGSRVRYSLDDPGHDQDAEGAEDHRLSEWESDRWREDALSLLPPRQRQVMERVGAGFDTKEIAQDLGMSADAVRRSRSDARKSLSKVLRPDGEYRRAAGPAAVRERSVSRAADHAVSASTLLAARDWDLRGMSPGEREESAAKVEELTGLLRRCPAGAFGAGGSAVVLANVAALAGALVADRAELAALKLIRVAYPHLTLADGHPAAFGARRARAEALCELGYRRAAQSLLGRLGEEERQSFGAESPQTVLLLHWAQAMSGQFVQAETGLRDLAERLDRSQGCGTPTIWHVQCRRCWVLGQCGQARESAVGYDGVVFNRSSTLGSRHADVLDARHSKGKMLVVSGAGAEAITILQAVAEDRARVQGDRHSDTLESLKYVHLACVAAEPADDRVLDKAIAGLAEVLDIQVSRHGPGYPMSRDTATWLSSLHRRREAIRSREPVHSLQKVPRQI